MRNAVVVIQMLTMVVLAVWFFRDHRPDLGLAQFCYVVATAALFIGGTS